MGTVDGRTLRTGTGILISGFDGVVVKNGTITGFEVGVSIVFGADQTRVRDLRISGDGIGNGIEAQALRAEVTGNTVFGRAIGIVVSGTTTTATANTVKDNDTGILIAGSRPVVTRNSALSNAGHGIQTVAEAAAITGNVARTATTASTSPARPARRSTATARPSTPGSASTPTGTWSTQRQRGDGQRQPAPVRKRLLRRGAMTPARATPSAPLASECAAAAWWSGASPRCRLDCYVAMPARRLQRTSDAGAQGSAADTLARA